MGLSKGFPARLKAARERVGMTQTDVASALGIAPQSVQKWESGETEPRQKRVDALAKVLGVSTVSLRYGERRPGGKADALSTLFDEQDPFTAALVSLARAEFRLRGLTREVRAKRRDALESSIDTLQDKLHDAGYHTVTVDGVGTARIDLPDQFCSFYVAPPEVLSAPKGPISFSFDQFHSVETQSGRSAVAVPLLRDREEQPTSHWLFIPCALLTDVPAQPDAPLEARFRRVTYEIDGDDLRVYLVHDNNHPMVIEITPLIDESDPSHIFDLAEHLLPTG